MSSKKTETKKSTKTAETKKVAEKKSFTKPVEQLKRDIRATPIQEWDWDRLIFSTPKKGEFPDGSGAFRRVYLSYRYDEDTMGPAIVSLSEKFCFGVQPDNLDKDGNVLKDKNTDLPKPLRGYKVPLVMTGQTKDEPENITDTQRAEVEFFDTFREVVLKWAFDNKKEIGKANKKTIGEVDAIVSKILYRKYDEDGNVVETSSPMLYTNLIYYSNKKQIDTAFYGPGDKQVDPLSMTSPFNITANIRFDSVFVGKEISLQHRVYDGVVVPRSTTQKKRLAPKNTVEATEEQTPEPSSKNRPELVESEEDEPPPSPKKDKKKTKPKVVEEEEEQLESEEEFFEDE